MRASFIRTSFTHPEYESDYSRGVSAARADLRKSSFESCRDQFNEKYPPFIKFENMAEFYYADGYSDALLESRR